MSLIETIGPNETPLDTLEWKLRAWLGETWITTKLGQEGVEIPTLGITGFRQREQQLNTLPTGAGRVLLMPGSGLGDSRRFGALEMPLMRGSGNANRLNPRATFGLPLKFTVSCWAVDNTDKTNEKLQFKAVWNMVETVLAGFVATVGARVIADGEIYQDKYSANMSYGIELLVPLAVRSLFFGLPDDTITDVSPVIQKVPNA